ncbi:MAG: class I SAM-dependent methyltransferase, partial [Chlorobiales bacterium]|nr:class I SAM-dependent methyltransferase [Chlorobiales bacterium]
MANHIKSKSPELNGSAHAADSLVKTKSHDQIRSMFDDVAPTYDLLNHVLSVGTDFYWRWKARQKAKRLLNGATAKVLDVATGTGDLAVAMLKLPGATVKGMDVSPEMISIARKKCPQISFE